MNNAQTAPRSVMRAGRTLPAARGRLAAALAAACLLTAGAAMADDSRAAPFDVANALRALPQVEVVGAAADGVPNFLRGDLGRAPRLDAKDVPTAERTMRDLLAPALAPMRLQAVDLRLRKVNDGERGNQHLRYSQTFQGLDVIGGDLVVHVDNQGRIFAVNGTARGDIPATLGRSKIGEKTASALILRDKRYAGMAATPPRTVVLQSPDGVFAMAYETELTGTRGQDPVHDKVYIDVTSGAVLAVHPQIHFALNRQVSTANNGYVLPGVLKRTEGGAATPDVDVNAAYDSLGATYQAYKTFWNRDSYDNAGAPLLSTVNYRVSTSTAYCNAYWDGTRLVYGKGDSARGCLPLARSQDITGHEYTHAVTANESRLLNTMSESGALNESISDIFGAFTEAFVDGRMTGTLIPTSDTWTIGEDVFTGSSKRLVRHMNDPADPTADTSLDFYDSLLMRTMDPHLAAGVGNLAFYLMSQGGQHPRGKSDYRIVGIGMAKAIRVFYEANVNILTSNATFLTMARATVQAAINLGYSADVQRSIGYAWQAVGVPVMGPVVLPVTPLVNNEPVTGLTAGSTAKMFVFDVPAGKPMLNFTVAGGTGDVQMYVKFGSMPTTTNFDCRWYSQQNQLIFLPCKFSPPTQGSGVRAGKYYVLLTSTGGYSNIALNALHTNPTATVMRNGETVTISGSATSVRMFSVVLPPYRTLSAKLSDGDGRVVIAITNNTPVFGAAPCEWTLAGVLQCNGSGVPSSSTAFIRVEGMTDYNDLKLTVTY